MNKIIQSQKNKVQSQHFIPLELSLPLCTPQGLPAFFFPGHCTEAEIHLIIHCNSQILDCCYEYPHL